MDDTDYFIEESVLDNEPTLITLRLLREVSQGEDLIKVISVNLHGRGIEQIQCLEHCPNLRTLDVSFNRIVKLEGLNGLSKLKELKIYDNLISSIQGLQQLTSLHTLDLSGNRIKQLEGLAGLRSLKVLRAAYNQLESLDSLGRSTTQLEVLDLTGNALRDLGGLSSCTALRELTITGNRLSNLKGLQRCQQLRELYAADNMLTTLQGLKACAATIEIVSITGNKLSSLEGLAEGCSHLMELYASDNHITSLAPLPTRAPNLEMLDVGTNCLAYPDLTLLISLLAQLPELSSLRLEANAGLPLDYAQALLKGAAHLDAVDLVERPRQTAGPDIWANEEGNQQTAGSTQFHPTISEMEEFKRRMGINSELPPMGRPDTQGQLARPPSAIGRPASALLRTSMATLRPGTASTSGRPGSAALRPGSRGGPGSGAVRDVMMHQRAPSARTGGAARVMTPLQYSDAVVAFKDTMDSYSQQLRSVLTHMRAGLQMDITAAAQHIRAPENAAARQLPQVPVLPEMPRSTGQGAAATAPGQAGAAGPAASSGPGSSRGAPGATAGGAATARPALSRLADLDDPEVGAALDHFRRVFPERSASSRPGSSSSSRSTVGLAGPKAAGAPGTSAAARPGVGAGEGRGEDDEESDREEVIEGGGEEEEENPVAYYNIESAGPVEVTDQLEGGRTLAPAAQPILGAAALVSRPSTPSRQPSSAGHEQSPGSQVLQTATGAATVAQAPGQQLRARMPGASAGQTVNLRPASPKVAGTAPGGTLQPASPKVTHQRQQQHRPLNSQLPQKWLALQQHQAQRTGVTGVTTDSAGPAHTVQLHVPASTSAAAAAAATMASIQRPAGGVSQVPLSGVRPSSAGRSGVSGGLKARMPGQQAAIAARAQRGAMQE